MRLLVQRFHFDELLLNGRPDAVGQDLAGQCEIKVAFQCWQVREIAFELGTRQGNEKQAFGPDG